MTPEGVWRAQTNLCRCHSVIFSGYALQWVMHNEWTCKSQTYINNPLSRIVVYLRLAIWRGCTSCKSCSFVKIGWKMSWAPQCWIAEGLHGAPCIYDWRFLTAPKRFSHWEEFSELLSRYFSEWSPTRRGPQYKSNEQWTVLTPITWVQTILLLLILLALMMSSLLRRFF